MSLTSRRKRGQSNSGFDLSFIFVALLFLFAFVVWAKWDQGGSQSSFASVPREEDREAFYQYVQSVSGDWEEDAPAAEFEGTRLASLGAPTGTSTQVLGHHLAPDGQVKWIEVDLSDQKVIAWEGPRKVYEFPTSTGRPGYETVKGEFQVWRKVKYQRYVGGIKGTSTYYNLPNVPFSLFFYRGYALHGAYWHNDFGIKRRSSGCVNLRPADAEVLWNWSGPAIPAGANVVNSSVDNPGTRVVVHD